jgi:8-oxo-dGTP pyrophosphatase MutT (NUDIX family)
LGDFMSNPEERPGRSNSSLVRNCGHYSGGHHLIKVRCSPLLSQGKHVMSPTSESSQPDFEDVRRRADEFARHAYADVFARFERIRSGLDVNVPIVSAIIEREHNGEKEILVQTRWKPERDPLYSGTLEIPAGGMHVYENVYDAVKREVLEETGLRVTRFYPDIRTKTHAPKDDDCFAFVPFCCQQQLKGGLPRVGFVFLCQVEDAEPVPQHEEVRDIRWMTVSELRKIFEDTPKKIFTLQLGVLEYYLQHTRSLP